MPKLHAKELDLQRRIEWESRDSTRHGLPFTVLRFQRGRSGLASLKPLVEVAHEVSRATDTVVPLNNDQLVMLLPFVGQEGAQACLDKLREGLARRGHWAPALRPEIAVYPPTPPPASTQRRQWHGPLRLAGAADGESSVAVEPAGVIAFLSTSLPRWKRAIDVVLAAGGLAIFAPVGLAIALAVKLSSPGQIIYRQRRTGWHLDGFDILKFRTMHEGSHGRLSQLAQINEMSGPLFKASDDPRITSIGSLLRRTSLDELPQLWNVLRGDMTLIGPRALSPRPDQYESWQLRRFLITPGIACSWQASRRRETDFREWMRSDVGYAEKPVSLWTDFRLLLETVLSLVRAGGR